MAIKLVITIDLSAPTTGTVETLPRSGQAAQATIMDAFLTEKKLVSGCARTECRKGTAAIGIGKQTDNNGDRENCDSCCTRNLNGLSILNTFSGLY